MTDDLPPGRGATGEPEGVPRAAPAPDAPAPTVGRGGRRRDQALALGWLVAAWLLLWGDVSVGNLIAGLVVGVAVLLFFPLPPVTFGGRFRPRELLVFLVTFIAELVSASLHVAAVALRFGYRPRGAIIAVPLRVRTDLNLALTAEVISLVPGTLILDVDRARGVLYVHVLDVRGPEDVSGSRERVLAVERRIVRAIGSPAEVHRLDLEPVERRNHQ
ncbi:Na+/H+ antiporter subunit E [Micromonospora tulbaghiae]|uniref:Multisubunit sodium/proton antiporter, MrpE subunit (TC 2.A.63.1) n=1 Tax=Micromonospora tulbaghiae TaxID=479978 RepID=A0ABY0KKV5_9ACTN|nr:Na+/H+ antiporter subunit E [Micromonospora tulbaghiae]MDX5458008.1 Na+/H+ antiporter subunit E [Micromonospora tulbaghiae]SCE84474.1 multisubunit sodium/proton antiporter, MrpE subunit (TC 2.A.63.1) [Micromonospora tulbaghiae]